MKTFEKKHSVDPDDNLVQNTKLLMWYDQAVTRMGGE